MYKTDYDRIAKILHSCASDGKIPTTAIARIALRFCDEFRNDQFNADNFMFRVINGYDAAEG